MMSLDCPLAIRHKKGEYILMKIGEDFEFLELWSFRLYLGASWCIYFLAHDAFILMYFIFMGCICLGETLCFMFLFLLLFLVSHVLHWLLIYIMRLFMIHVFYFLLCEIKNLSFFFLLVFSTHTFMCLLSVSGIYRFIQSCCYLYWQLIDSS